MCEHGHSNPDHQITNQLSQTLNSLATLPYLRKGKEEAEQREVEKVEDSLSVLMYFLSA